MKELIRAALQNAGHTSLKPIQEKTIQSFETASELIVYSKTGSGKTLAFLLAHLNTQKKDEPAIILTPSRELCLQIETVFKSLKTGLKITLCYGGHSMKTEINSLSVQPDLIVATPGRLMDHIERENIDPTQYSTLIIDEFDKCLELGFDVEMGFIVQQLTAKKRTLLTSATKIDELPAYMGRSTYTIIDNLEKDAKINISTFGVELLRDDALSTLEILLNSFGSDKTMVFCNYREVTEDLSENLNDLGLFTIYYHGGLEQDERERALLKFRNESATILICTDLGARGLDIENVKHVVHYQYPSSMEAFTHRQGRTARMTASGNAYILVSETKQLPMYLEEPNTMWQAPQFQEQPALPKWTTLYFSAGKKDKVNKIDIVGFLSKKGMLQKGEIGKVDVLDRSSYAAVPRIGVNNLLQKIRNEKVKGKRLKIAISK